MSSSRPSDLFLLERPFGLASEYLLAGWWSAATLFTRQPPDAWLSETFAVRVSEAFAQMSRLSTLYDPHLFEGTFESLRSMPEESRRNKKSADSVRRARKPAFTRPYTLLLQQFRHNQVKDSLAVVVDPTKADRRNLPKQYLFSPFYFLRQMLTAPEYPASDGYAHVVVRAEIFAEAYRFAQKIKSFSHEIDPAVAIRECISFDDVAASLQKAESYRSNNDTFYPATATDFIVGHLLASHGHALLTFAPNDESYRSKRNNEKTLVGRDVFMQGKSLVPASGIYEFRIVDHMARLPSASELVNELDGCPLPIPGADVVFARGIRTTTERGVVGRVSGSSGAGKTSLALSIAVSLAPMGVTTFYLSCEEDAVDLEKRIHTLTPPFIRRTSTFPRDVGEWFYGKHLDMLDPEMNREGAIDFIDDLMMIYKEVGIEPASDAPPGIIPLFVVLDGVHELIQRKSDKDQVVEMRDLVERFTKLGALVLILTADNDELALRELDYAVNFVIRLEVTPEAEQPEEPLRKLRLVKTRLQYARPGSHILHISKRDGLKIYPYLSAQLDIFSNFLWKAPSNDRWYDFLQTGMSSESHPRALVRIYERSQILICGRGSAGKAGFALKLLMAPIEASQPDQPMLLFGNEPTRIFQDAGSLARSFKDPRRILVISFLYEATYYHNLKESILKGPSDSDSVKRHARPAV